VTNKCYLAALIAEVTGEHIETISDYINEIESDAELKTHLEEQTKESDLKYIADKTVQYGRRIGWYALVRATKPRVIIETGIDKGLGSCILTAALKKNKAEGFSGKYYGTDINPKAGYLLSGDYKDFGEILYGDSIESLENIDETIDLFINDSDHSDEYEWKEYLTIQNKLSSKAIILGDNSHCTDKLLKFSSQNDRHFVYFQEKPINHWYPGGGLGISFTR
jgi:predicted O-methyltransferase YrrM